MGAQYIGRSVYNIPLLFKIIINIYIYIYIQVNFQFNPYIFQLLSHMSKLETLKADHNRHQKFVNHSFSPEFRTGIYMSVVPPAGIPLSSMWAGEPLVSNL